MKGLNDIAAIFPHLPGKPIDDEIDTFAAPESEYREAWEYVLSHHMTETELSAFWHGVGLTKRAQARLRVDLST